MKDDKRNKTKQQWIMNNENQARKNKNYKIKIRNKTKERWKMTKEIRQKNDERWQRK